MHYLIGSVNLVIHTLQTVIWLCLADAALHCVNRYMSVSDVKTGGFFGLDVKRYLGQRYFRDSVGRAE